MTLAGGRLVVATHYYAPGAPFELADYLVPRAEELLFVAHPLYTGVGDSYFRHYEHHHLLREFRQTAPRQPLRYWTELRLTVSWVASHGSFDGFIACDNLLALAGLWLRRRGLVRWVVLYTMDFVPRRFENLLLNRIYHQVDSVAAHRADVAWNVSGQIGEARRRRDRDHGGPPEIVVPIGTHYERIERLPLQRALRYQLVFVGHLLEKQGLQLAIEAMPLIREQIPDATLLVIGDGPFASELKQIAQRLALSEVVEFAGFSDDSVDIENRIAASAVALAPYLPDPLSFTRFADPTKIKTYLACGVPVIMTDVPANADQVQVAGAGIVVPYDQKALADAAVSYLNDPAGLQSAREAASRLAREYLWDRTFDQAFEQTSTLLAGADGIRTGVANGLTRRRRRRT